MSKVFQIEAKKLGSKMLVSIVADKEPKELFKTLLSLTDQFEERFSRFKVDSELSRVNQSAGSKTKISKEFLELVGVALTYSKRTGGVFNPFILPELQKAGYLGSWPGSVSSSDKSLDVRSRSLTSFNDLELGNSWLRIPEDSALDFGGIGKGFLLDKLADFLHGKVVMNFWVSIGGDIICSGFTIDQKPWYISIADAGDEVIDLGSVELGGFSPFCALATSGTVKRRGQDWHHLIDPHTGRPSTSSVLTASVRAKSATEADIMAKCLQIVGTNSAAGLIKGYNLGYLLQFKDKGKLKTESYNWN